MARTPEVAATSYLCPPVQSGTAQQKSQTTSYDQEIQGLGRKRHRSRKRKRKSKSSSHIYNEEHENRNLHDEDETASKAPQNKQTGHNENKLNRTLRHPLSFNTHATTPLLSCLTQCFRNATLQPAHPLLEHQISATSPSAFIAAVSALEIFTSRATLLQDNITLLETRVQMAREESRLLFPKDPLVNQIVSTVRTYEEIMDLALEHLIEVSIHEHAFRDVFDETSNDELDVLAAYKDGAVREFGEIKRAYDRKLLPLLQKLSPQAMAVTVGQLVGIQEEVDNYDGSLANNEKDNVAGLDKVGERS
jgi:hypothetical protein